MHRLARTLARRVAPVMATTAAWMQAVRKDDEPKTTAFEAMPSPTTLTLLDQEDGTTTQDDQNGSSVKNAIDFTEGLFGVGLIATTNVAYCMDNPQEDNDLDDVFDRYSWRRGKIAERRGDSVMKRFHDKTSQERDTRYAQIEAVRTSIDRQMPKI